MIPLQIVLALIIFAIGWLWYDLQQTKKRIKNIEGLQTLSDKIQDKHSERIEKIENTKHLIMK